MKPELDRLKNDLATMQKALGLAPAMGRDWLQWMKRDKWFSLWWCLPGLILIAFALLPLDHANRYLALSPDQWAGLSVALVMVAITIVHSRKLTARDGRPEGLIRESKRVNGMTGEGLWFCLALLVEVILYFFWGKAYRIAFRSFWAGLFILCGIIVPGGCFGGASLDAAGLGDSVPGLRLLPAVDRRTRQSEWAPFRSDVSRRRLLIHVHRQPADSDPGAPR